MKCIVTFKNFLYKLALKDINIGIFTDGAEEALYNA